MVEENRVERKEAGVVKIGREVGGGRPAGRAVETGRGGERVGTKV